MHVIAIRNAELIESVTKQDAGQGIGVRTTPESPAHPGPARLGEARLRFVEAIPHQCPRTNNRSR
jgi:hypothetical protein